MKSGRFSHSSRAEEFFFGQLHLLAGVHDLIQVVGVRGGGSPAGPSDRAGPGNQGGRPGRPPQRGSPAPGPTGPGWRSGRRRRAVDVGGPAGSAQSRHQAGHLIDCRCRWQWRASAAPPPAPCPRCPSLFGDRRPRESFSSGGRRRNTSASKARAASRLPNTHTTWTSSAVSQLHAGQGDDAVPLGGLTEGGAVAHCVVVGEGGGLNARHGAHARQIGGGIILQSHRGRGRSAGGGQR